MNREKAIQIAVKHAKKWEGFCCREPYRSGVSNKYFSNVDSLPKDTKVWSYPDGRGFSVGWGSYNKLSTGASVTATTSISKEQADKEIEIEMREVDKLIFPKIKVPLTETQYAALLDTAYNAGSGSLNYTSNRRGETFPSLLTTVNTGGDTSKIFPKVAISDSGSGKVLPSLINRRNDASKLFSGGYDYLYAIQQFYQDNKKTINYAAIGLILLGMGGYLYYLKKKGIILKK
jgi:GH24 family phage-related lysozyme (muramidase)